MFNLGPFIGAGVFFALLIGGFSAHVAYKKHFMTKGEQVVIEKSVTEGEKINEKVKKRISAVRPGTYVDELLKLYCRDCK